MEGPVDDDAGGIRRLLVEFRAHEGAINHDLINRGWTRADLGVRVSWSEFYSWLRWHEPSGESAYHRSLFPDSWWVTPELQVWAGILFAAQSANWQRGGCKGPKPTPIEFPRERRVPSMDAEELAARKAAVRRAARGES